MSSLSTRLAALEHPGAETFDASSQSGALAAWLEDRFIRQLPVDGRGPLREQQPGALQSYLEELDAPVRVQAALAGGDGASVCSWLVNLALSYEYGDNRDKHDAAAAQAAQAAQAANATAASSASGLLAGDDPNLLGLAAALGVTPGADATATLQAVVKAARQRPRPSPPPAAPPPKRPAPPPEKAAAARAQRDGALVGIEAFPLGFSTGNEALDSACRVLRMLYVRELRRLQDRVNAAIVVMQDYTSNPRTDARLGRVGR